jgi:hypothetical protein
MRLHRYSTRVRRVLLIVVASLAGAASTGSVSGQQAPIQYAVKFVCGVAAPVKGAPPPPVAPGAYFTAVNVHNPNNQPLEFRKKFAIALPAERAGRVSPFFGGALKPDEALEIDCPDILKHLDTQGFVKGFVVIESPRELDVVAVYTAAASPAGPVVTMEIERVPKRP